MSDEFKDSREWLDKFHRRNDIHGLTKHGEVTSSDNAAAEANHKEFMEFVPAERCVTRQMFNCREAGLLRKKMLRRTCSTQEEKPLPGHEPRKERDTSAVCKCKC